ncbi:MAG: hypothetical protein L7T60_06005 [Flavobacteriaceae bacterium]|nr:hypothetical protein [Flavobacteriaceae bacterium]
MEVRKSILTRLKSISGAQYILIVLTVSIIKYSLGFYVSGSRNITFLAVLLGNALSIFSLAISFFRAYRFKEWKIYFSLLIIIGIIHSIGWNFFSTDELMNSHFYSLVKIATLLSLIILITLTISNSNKQQC